jgi:predicted SAM-dependent methyltransferase
MGLRLDIGSGPNPAPGYTGVDIIPFPGGIVADLRKPWPFEDGSVEAIRAHDVIEHLPDKNFTISEMERVLCPRGAVDIMVPSTDGRGAFQDPTHVSFWNQNSFLYYDIAHPDYLALNKRYGYPGSGFLIESLTTRILSPSDPTVCHVRVLMRKP